MKYSCILTPKLSGVFTYYCRTLIIIRLKDFKMMKTSKIILAAALGLSIAVLNCGLGTMVNASAYFYKGYLPAACSCTYDLLCFCLFLIPGNFRMKSLW